MQPPSSYITAGQAIEIPLGSEELHHEIELGVVIKGKCKRVTEDQAMDYVGGYCLALDMTARDFQVVHLINEWSLKFSRTIFRTKPKRKDIPGQWLRQEDALSLE